MTGHHSTRTLLIAIVLMGWPAAMAYAQTAAGPEGTYCLRGVHEVGSCLRLAEDSTLEYFLAYGAYDENSKGYWKADGADVVLDSPPYDKAPTFTFKRFEPVEGDGFDIAVVNTAGNRINGINVRATCDGRAVEMGVTGAGGYKVDCASAPTEVALGLENVRPRLPGAQGSQPRGSRQRANVFELDPGDLGAKRFAGTRLRREGPDSLVMTYANPAIRELNGKTFTYELERE